MKARVALVLAALSLVSLVGCSTGEPEVVEMGADYPFYPTLTELCSVATLVVVVTPGSASVREVEIKQLPSDSVEEDPSLGAPGGEVEAEPWMVVKTVTTLRIKSVLKGDPALEGTDIQVGQLGGTFKNIRYEAKQYGLKKGGKYVLFLETYPDSPTSLLNPTQAGFEVSASNELVAGADNDVLGGRKTKADATICG